MAAVPTTRRGITAAWLDAVASDRLGARVRRIAARRIGVGFGLAGLTYRVDVTREGAPPAALVVKLCDAASARREGRMYTEILPRTDLAVPSFVTARDDGTAGVVIIDFVEGARQGDCLAGCTFDEARALARGLAALHAPWWGLSREDCPDWLRSETDEFTASRSLPDDRIRRCLRRMADVLDDDARALIRALPDGLGADHQALAAHPMSITHRDFHLDNVLFEPLRGPILLDWPNAGRGAVAVDVGRVLVECLRAKDLPAGRDAVFDAYLDELSRRGVTHPGRDELARGVALGLRLLLAGAVGWAGSKKAARAGSRVAEIPRNLVVNCVAALMG